MNLTPDLKDILCQHIHIRSDKVVLCLDGDLDVDAAIAKLESCSRVNRLCVAIFNSFNERLMEEKISLFESLGRLSQLSQLRICSRGYLGNVLPVDLLSICLSKLVGLTDLGIIGTTLAGDDEAFANLTASITRHVALKNVNLHCCQLSLTRSPTVYGLDNVMRAFALVPSINRIEVHASEISCLGNLKHDSLYFLADCPTLQSLVIENFDLSNHHVEVLARSLGNTSSLKELGIMCTLGSSGGKALAEALRKNESIEILNLELLSLEREGLMAVVRALGQNSTVREFRVLTRDPTFNEGVVEAMIEVLQSNTTISVAELIHDYGMKRVSNQSIDLYLKLNQVGRAALFEQYGDGCNDTWLKALTKVSDDASACHYLLRQNPALFETGLERNKDKCANYLPIVHIHQDLVPCRSIYPYFAVPPKKKALLKRANDSFLAENEAEVQCD